MTFTEADLRKLHAKWADDVGLTNDTLLGTLAPISLGAMKTTPSLAYASTGPGKTLANRDRFNVTTRSNSLHLHNLMPMTANVLTDAKFMWHQPGTPNASPVPTSGNGLITSPLPTFLDPAAGTYGTQVLDSAMSITTDFDRSLTIAGNPVKLRGGVGALPALDLNRPLTDYRHPLAIKYNLPLRPDNVIMPTALQLPQWYINNGLTPAVVAATPGLADGAIVNNHFTVNGYTSTTLLFNAMRDRQELAKDIFARLVVATGASASYMKWNGYCLPNPLIDGGLGVAPNPDYDALRYLAQLAANIVDYIDGDDVATTFVWNPINPQVMSSFDPTVLTGLAAPTAPAPLDQLRRAADSEPRRRRHREAEADDQRGLLRTRQQDERNGHDAGPAAARTPLPPRTDEPERQRRGERERSEAVRGANDSVERPEAERRALLRPEPTDCATSVQPDGHPYSAYVVDLHVQRRRGDHGMGRSPTRANLLGANAIVVADRRVDFAALAGVSLLSPAAGYPTHAAAVARANPKQTALFPEADPAFAGPVPPSPQAVAPVGTKYLPVAGANAVAQGYLLLAPASIPNQRTTPSSPRPRGTGRR